MRVMKQRSNWRRFLKYCWGCLAFLLTACSYPSPDYSDWDMTPVVRDSLRFLLEHHYTMNYNFQVTGDSLLLCEKLPDMGDSVYIYKDNELVIADYVITPTDTVDSVWVKVARDQETMGWIPEQVLLKGIVPVDPISKFIHMFSNVHAIVLMVLLGLFILSFLYRRLRRKQYGWAYFKGIRSVYSVWLCVLVASAATLYASMQLFVPQTWQHYYYNPTMNPFELPFILACFIASVWAIIIVALAVVDELVHRTDFSTAFFYLLGLGSFCLLSYLFFTFTTYYYIGYPCLLVFLIYSFRYLHEITQVYVCGNCGEEIKEKGFCPHCGAFNK